MALPPPGGVGGAGLGGSGSQEPPDGRRVRMRSLTARTRGTPKVRVPLRMIWVPGRHAGWVRSGVGVRDIGWLCGGAREASLA